MQISQREVEAQYLDEDSLVEAVRQVREVGFVVLEKTMSPAWTETMRVAWEDHLEGHRRIF
ncbi:MAG: hypothetical protein ACI8PG_000187 [Planctomycetota bacterium]|jgi:hypothetical protein|tara:strand:- start:416 stop:598 length:183 start_codon:yes stop_codon:yes gene_type:complete